MKFLRLIGNVIWFCTIGLALFLGEIAAAVFSCVLIFPIFLGIPKVHFRCATYVIFPFGKKVKTHFFKAPVRNILALVLGGFFDAIGGLISAALFAITIIGIPVAKVLFNVSKLSFAPFHAEIEKK